MRYNVVDKARINFYIGTFVNKKKGRLTFIPYYAANVQYGTT